jgi:Spy/CpxP family protein refolding chaperone
MKTNAIKGMIIPLFLTWLCFIFLLPNNVMAQNKQDKNGKKVRVERAVVAHQENMAFKLTDDQKAKIKDLRLEHMKAVQLLKAQNEEMVAHLKTLRLAEKPDNKAMFKTIDEMMATRGEIMKREVSFREAFKAILTPEQIKAMESRGFANHFGMGARNQNWRPQGNHQFGRGQMMQRGGMNRPGMMMNRGQMPQGAMMNRQGQGFGGRQMMPQVQMQRRFQVVKEGPAKTPDTTKVK